MRTQSMEQFFNAQRSRSGALGVYIAGFAADLAARGYAVKTTKYKVRLVAHFGEWLMRQPLELEALSQGVVEEFLRHRNYRRAIRAGDAATLIGLLEHLRERGALPSRSAQAPSEQVLPVDLRFERYLVRERGLARPTVVSYVLRVRHFLSARFGAGQVRPEDLCSADVTDFILGYARDMAPRTAGLMVSALRSFFRFLRFEGLITVDLSGAVLTVPNWRLSEIPKSLEPAEVDALLACSKGEGATRLRDHAILLLLSRLGLRAGEVVSLALDDLDWDSGQITVSGKGLRTMQLPILKDVGNALASYLRHSRPMCSDRHVFIRSRAPHVGFSSSVAICNVVRRALTRAGLSPARKGAHLLRHSLAVRMLRSGASLAQIGDVLGHQSPSTTEVYAKVDIGSLHALAQPWPGGAS